MRVDILINGDRVDALSMIVHRSPCRPPRSRTVREDEELIPRQMFDVAIQAAVGAQIIARSTVKAMRKNVLAKCYGGDVTRKKKLLEKQKEGKKRMKQVGQRRDPAGSLPGGAADRQQVRRAISRNARITDRQRES